MIEQMRTETPSLAQDFGICEIEATAYSVLGMIAVGVGTSESSKKAVGHFEKQWDICKAVGNGNGVSAAESNIAFALSKCKGGVDISVGEQLKCCREMYIECETSWSRGPYVN